jgi:hypothetical protein
MIRDSIARCLDRWADLPAVIRVLLPVLVAGGLGLFAVKAGYGWFGQWRLERNLASARKAVGEVRMKEARDRSLSALRSGERGIEAFRILEKSTAALRDPRHAEIARVMIFHPEGADEDRLTGFLGLVDKAPLGLVGRIWAELPDADRTDPRFAAAFARRLLDAGRMRDAAGVLTSVPEQRRDGAVLRALVAALIGSGRHEGMVPAWTILAESFPAGGPESVAWLELLESIPPTNLAGGLLEELRERLENVDGVSPGRRALMVRRLEYAGSFAERAAILDQAAADWRGREPREFARFLHGLGLHRQLLAAFPDPVAGQDSTVYRWLLDSACRSADWERLRGLLDAGGGVLSRAETAGLRAVLAAKTGGAADAASAWSDAMRETKARPDSGTALMLHQLAVLTDLPEQANQALLAAVRTGRGALPLYEDLKPLLDALAAQGQEKTLLEIVAIYLRYEPGSPLLLARYASLACLNDLVEPAVVLQALEPLARELPEELPLQCAVATAFLMDSKPQQAAVVLDRLRVDIATLPPSQRVVFLVSRVRNGTLGRDHPEVTGFPWKTLLPSERREFIRLLKD